MKIVQINTGIGFGSIGRIEDQIGSLVEKEGGICYYAHGSRYIVHSSPNAIKVGPKFEDYIHYGISLITGRDGIGSKCSTKRLVRKLTEIKPDIVHLHNIHGYYINYKILFEYLSKSNTPVVWTFHDCWPITGHCPYFDKVNCIKWKTECYDCPLCHEFPKSLIFDQSSYNYNSKKSAFISVKNLNIVPVSSWLGDIVKESFLKDANIRVIHNGIDIDVFKPTSSNLRERLGVDPNKKIILGIASGWDERKGFSDFVKLALEGEWQIVMVGDFEVDASRLPLSVIHIKNTNSQKELAELYSIADVFINPTYSDNFPTTNIEALACGTPVITYKTGGSPEALDENTGIVVPQGNLTELINAIKKITSVSKTVYSNKCRERAVKFYNKDSCFKEYINLYKEILNNGIKEKNQCQRIETNSIEYT